MFKLFLFNLTSFLVGENLNLWLQIILVLLVSSWALCFLLALFVNDYSYKKRLWIIPCHLGLIVLAWWAQATDRNTYYFEFLCLAVSAFLCAFIFAIPNANNQIKSEHINLARIFSEQAKNDEVSRTEDFKPLTQTSEDSDTNEHNEIKVIKACPKEQVQAKNYQELDFSHVKRIINKLEYYSINNQERKQAKELMQAVELAESKGQTPELKEKINEGLGALLKIMSKYAV